MMHEMSISRRRFFGLSRPQSCTTPAPDDPPVPGGPLVEECETTVDRAVALLDEIQREGSHIQIGVRHRDPAHQESTPPTIAGVGRLLRDNLATAVQVRYRFGDCLWIDTFTPAAAVVRVVRVRHEFAS